MDLSEPPKRPRGESIVPMINVVFLLLIFFLMTSQLAQPDPFDVTPPEAQSEAEAEAEPVLFVDDTGRLSFAGSEGRQALEALSALSGETAV
ncbi:ExbD/TolR family protein, partial [Cribrihabitans sp. XS_ASV171]